MAKTTILTTGHATQADSVRSISESLQVTLAIMVGLMIFAGVAFAHPQIVHNAAHDARHALSVPCH